MPEGVQRVRYARLKIAPQPVDAWARIHHGDLSWVMGQSIFAADFIGHAECVGGAT
jgi:hypothetical protein